MATHCSTDPSQQLQAEPGARKRREQPARDTEPAPMTLRILRTRPLAYSQRFTDTFQQWIKGEWRNVEIVTE